MKPETTATILTIALAGAAGYLTGGIHVAVIYCLLAGAAICWKFAR